ncbi:MAG: EF-hand domain-containing protein [Azospirillaceae bacterium]|nr:EF-hand domain-containing protein [Azospirillaceae bacterium]
MHHRLRFRRHLIRPVLMGGLALVAACSSHKVFYNVNTPLGQSLGRTTSEDTAKATLRAWFARVDANQDGKLSRDEFQVEADAVFTHYDLNGDGALNVTELEQVRQADRMAQAGHGGHPGGPPPNGGPDGAPNGGPPPGGPGGGPGMGGGRGGVDPIMAADTNLDFRVTREEFRTYARALFDVIDADHDGQLTFDEVEKADLTVQEPGSGGHGGGEPGGGMGGGHHGGGGGMGGGPGGGGGMGGGPGGM